MASRDDRAVSQTPKRVWGLTWLVLVLGVFGSFLACQHLRRLETRVAEADFRSDARQRVVSIREQFDETAAALEDLASLYAVSDAVSRTHFRRFVGPILARHPALKALSWNPVVSWEERAEHEEAARRGGLTDYRITERSAEGRLVRAQDREQYVVVAAIEPSEGNQAALGFDVASEETRRKALERARDTGLLSVAAPLALVQEDGRRQGALSFLPRYRTDAPVETVQQRQQHLVGFFVAVVNAAEIIGTVLAKLEPSEIELCVQSLPAGPDLHELYASRPDACSEFGGIIDAGAAASDPGSRLASQTSIEWGGHELRLSLRATEAYIASHRTWAPSATLFGGSLLMAMVALLFQMARGRTARVEREVRERTCELHELNLGLEKEIVQRKAAEKELAIYRDHLEREVNARTSELRATTNQLRTILDSEPECVKIVSEKGELVTMNAAGLAMIEADSLEQVVGRSIYPLISEEHRAAYIDLNRRVIAGESRTLEFEIKGLRGKKLWVESHAAPLVDPNVGSVRHLAITRDITARKTSEQEQAKLESQLRHAQKLESIGVMAGGIAHDFNNLLQVIMGNSELALTEIGAEHRSRKRVEASHEAAVEAAKLCDQMLTYSGQARADVQPLSLPDIVGSIVGLLKVSHTKNSTLELDLDAGVSAVEGDEAQLAQVVMNLVTNAAEAIGDRPGRITVRIRGIALLAGARDTGWIGQDPPEGSYVSLEVSDTGRGMSPETLERIFDPFFSTKFTGRGLGLAATLGIIRGHGGFLRVESEPDHGTIFTILLPATNSQISAPAEGPDRSRVSLEGTILVVDDEPQVRTVGRAILERLGFDVLEAADGEEALRSLQLHADEISLVLLDLTMPKLGGNETCVAMRRMRPELPILFCSGYADDAVSIEAADRAFTGFLHKPYRRLELLEALRSLLEASRDRTGSDPEPAS